LKLALRILLLAVVAAGGVWLWRVLFPGDEAVIRRQLHELAEVASFPANEAPLAKVTNAEKVAGFFAVDGEVDMAPWGYQRIVIGGRDELREAARGARFGLASLTVGVEAVNIVLGPGDDQATASLTLVGRTAGNPERQSQAMEFEFRRVDGDWLIRRAKTVEYLRP
jgi:hypothetical protein